MFRRHFQFQFFVYKYELCKQNLLCYSIIGPLCHTIFAILQYTYSFNIGGKKLKNNHNGNKINNILYKNGNTKQFRL
jgi:hypothetical protein